RLTQRPFSQAGTVWNRGGAQDGNGHALPPEQSATCACSASAAFFVTARGVHIIGQHAPGATRVKAQSSSAAQGASSAVASPAAPRWAAAASAAVIGPEG